MSTAAALFAPGFFASGLVHIALAIGVIVSVVVAPVGVFTVIRGQAFAGEAFGDIATTGGSAAFLVGVAPLWGFLLVPLVAAGAMELAGVQRPRGRDLAIGIVLGLGLGLAALLIYLETVSTSTTGEAATILFGSLFTVASSTLPLVLALGAIVLTAVALLFRPLTLCSLNAELAAARGIRVRLIGALHLCALAVAVALAATTIGTILSTALLIGPAATALRLTRRIGRAIALAAAIGVGATWLGIVLAYDSFDWSTARNGWPVSFFVVAVIFAGYLLSGLSLRRRRGR